MLIYVFIAIAIVILVYIFIIYNQLITIKNRVNEAFSTVDVYLKKRWDLIPNLIEILKGYCEHEKNTLNEVIELRNKNYDDMNTNDKVNINNQLVKRISELMVLAEAYPDLKASDNFINLSSQLTMIEDDLANARKYYNGTVRMMNDKIQMFPSNIVALIFRFKSFKMFEATVDERQNIKIEL